ncbi:MAG: DUF4276 family protein [bacterium]|nr:DUF4276 family protein [bacterium]
MNSVRVYVIVEGPTEQTFVRDLLAPTLSVKGLYLYASLIGKSGHKGGDIRFHRAKTDIVKYLKQQSDIYVSTLFDYYGINANWPGRATARNSGTAAQKANIMEGETLKAIEKELPLPNINKRFIPYIAMHEFEALLFSDAGKLAKELDVEPAVIDGILKKCGEPEEINDNSETAPSKRLIALCSKSYRKVKMGNTIAKAIGIQTMRDQCPHFNEWLNKLESLIKS